MLVALSTYLKNNNHYHKHFTCQFCVFQFPLIIVIIFICHFARPLSTFSSVKMKICGPKLSLCGLIISAWGIVQLALMGVFYHMKSVALVEDLPGNEGHFASATAYYDAVDKGFTLNAYNCWIAAVLYFLTLLLSAQQFHANTKSSISL